MPAYVGEKITKHNIETNSIKYARSYNEKRKRCVLCVETGETFDSLNDVERKKGIKHSSLCEVLQGKRKTAGGFHWKQINNLS